jgi:hypothetical protein
MLIEVVNGFPCASRTVVPFGISKSAFLSREVKVTVYLTTPFESVGTLEIGPPPPPPPPPLLPACPSSSVGGALVVKVVAVSLTHEELTFPESSTVLVPISYVVLGSRLVAL